MQQHSNLRDYQLHVERVRPCAPPGQEQRQTNGLHDSGESSDGNGIEWALLGEDLSDELATCQHVRKPHSTTSKLTDGAELAKKIKVPMYAAPL